MMQFLTEEKMLFFFSLVQFAVILHLKYFILPKVFFIYVWLTTEWYSSCPIRCLGSGSFFFGSGFILFIGSGMVIHNVLWAVNI